MEPVIHKLAVELFGPGCLSGQYVSPDVKFFVRGLVLLYWQAMRKQWQSAMKKIKALESKIRALQEGM